MISRFITLVALIVPIFLSAQEKSIRTRALGFAWDVALESRTSPKPGWGEFNLLGSIAAEAHHLDSAIADKVLARMTQRLSDWKSYVDKHGGNRTDLKTMEAGISLWKACVIDNNQKLADHVNKFREANAGEYAHVWELVLVSALARHAPEAAYNFVIRYKFGKKNDVVIFELAKHMLRQRRYKDASSLVHTHRNWFKTSRDRMPFGLRCALLLINSGHEQCTRVVKTVLADYQKSPVLREGGGSGFCLRVLVAYVSASIDANGLVQKQAADLFNYYSSGVKWVTDDDRCRRLLASLLWKVKNPEWKDLWKQCTVRKSTKHRGRTLKNGQPFCTYPQVPELRFLSPEFLVATTNNIDLKLLDERGKANYRSARMSAILSTIGDKDPSKALSLLMALNVPGSRGKKDLVTALLELTKRVRQKASLKPTK